MKSRDCFAVAALSITIATCCATAGSGDWWSRCEADREHLLLHLAFDEGQGEVTRDGVRGLEARVRGAEWVAGSPSGRILTFDGKGGLTVPDSPSAATRGDFTVEVLCRPAVLDSGYLVLKKYEFGFPCFTGDGKVSCYIRRSDEKDWVKQIPDLAVSGGWQHFAMTCSGRDVRIYRNGELKFSGALPVERSRSTSDILIGASGGWGEKNFTGDVALVRLYDVSLSDEEIRGEYQSLITGNGPMPNANVAVQRPGIPLKRLPGLNPAEPAGSALRFDGSGSFVEVPLSEALDVTDAITVGVWIRPERVNPTNMAEQGYIVSKGSGNHAGYMLTTYYQQGLAALVVTDQGPFTATAANVLRAGEWQHVAFTWGNNLLQIYVDGLPVGKAVETRGRLRPYAGPFHVGRAADREGQYFAGDIDDVRVWSVAVGMESLADAGRPMISEASNTDPSGFVQAHKRYLAGLAERRKPLVDFEDLTGWTVETRKGFVTAGLYRSQEKRLWGEHVAKVVFRATGDIVPADESRRSVIIRPPEPIPIPAEFDSIDLWVYGTYYYRPGGFTISLQFEDNQGRLRSVILDGRSGPHSDVNGVFWGGWSIAHRTLNEIVSPPAKFVSLTIGQIIGDHEQVTYLDSLSFYVADRSPVPSEIPSWSELDFPTRPDTILPDLGPGITYRNSVIKEGDTVTLRYEGSDETIFYGYRPATGTLSDIQAIYKGSVRFQPMRGGGLVLDVAGRRIQPEDPAVRRTLENYKVGDEGVRAVWRYEVEGDAFLVDIGLRIKQKSLIVDVASDTRLVSEVRIGTVAGLPRPKLVEVPYLTLSGAMHPSEDPAILCTDDLFLSVFMDWYNSDASELFGEKGLAEDGTATCNGGSAYFPLTNGSRNPLRERIFLNISGKFSEVLPTIPNPPSPRLQRTRRCVWATQQWPLDRKAYQDILDGKAPPYFEQLFAFWARMKRYGVDDLLVHFRINSFHPGPHQSETIEGEPESSYFEADPLLGGDEAVREFVRKIEGELGYTAVPYTNYTIMYPLNYRYWDENLIALWPDGAWKYGAGPSFLIKPSRTLAREEFFDTRLKEKFGFRASYADQYTARAPWACTDYDARVPDAGKFSVPFRVYGELLRRQRERFGELVFSEGNMHWLFAGLCDGNYGMLRTIDQPVLVDFRLLKMNPLTNDFGFHLRHYAGDRLHWWVASEIAYGSTGMVYGRSWLPPHPQRIEHFLKSYFLIRQLQEHYAATPVERIGYNSAGRVVPTEEAIRSDAYRSNQVHLVYANGLEIYVNRNASENWTVSLNGRTYVLPPDGFVCERRGELLEYSALVDGRRVDYVEGALYTYFDGGGKTMDFGRVSGAQAYVLRKEAEGFRLVPAPFRGEDTVRIALELLGLPAAATPEVSVRDEEGKSLRPAAARVVGDSLEIRIGPDAFDYVILLPRAVQASSTLWATR